jgi:hypothetical protein
VFERGDQVSELRSAIDALRAETCQVSDAVIEEDVAELHRTAELLEVERLRRLAEIERRRLHERDGHLSAAAWLATRFRIGGAAARDGVSLARALDHMPGTRRALEDGDLPLSGARVLASAREADPDAFARSEAHLVDTTSPLTPGEARAVLERWRETVERDRGIDGEERLLARRRLHASVTLQGMVRVDGDPDPEGGETLLTALRAVQDAHARSKDGDDRRTPAQRRADALTEICRQWLDLAERPTVAAERPHVTVTISADALASSAGTGDLDHVGPTRVATARRLACDASVMRLVLSARSEPLDVGRRSHVVPPSMRRAVIVRDRTCRSPGCDCPHTWCDAHHVVHWADGGPTSVDNLVLMCRRHHRLIHRPRSFTVTMHRGHPTFHRPDGTVLERSNAPP